MENKNLTVNDIRDYIDHVYDEFQTNNPDESKISKEDVDKLNKQIEDYIESVCNTIQVQYHMNSELGLEAERTLNCKCPRDMKYDDGSPMECIDCPNFVTVKQDKEEIFSYDVFDAYCLKGENE